MYKKDLIIRHLRRFLLVVLPIVCMTMAMLPAFALGLGEMRLRSSLGQSLLVHVDVVGSDAESINPTCLRARVVTMDGIFIANANIVIQQSQKRRVLSFSTKQAINEPAINLIIDIHCETQLHREFSILLDPPEASGAVAGINRDESPFGNLGKSDSAPTKDTAALDSVPASKATPKKKTQRARDVLPDTSSLSDVPVSLPKKKKVATVPAKDVLRLSDDIATPELPQGLRMSDVLSSEAGQKLVENMQELKAAQARMAAILRDEVAPVAAVSESAPSMPTSEESVELASLKRETEQLRKQNQLDKSALAQLQNKSGFDYWLLALAVVATLAIFIILFLLLYIRRNLSGQNATWWEEEDALPSTQPERIEDVINNLQANYDTNDAAKFDVESGRAGSASEAFEKTNSTVKPGAEVLGATEDMSLSRTTDNNKLHRTPSLEETNSSIFNFFTPRGNSVKVEEISDVTQEAEFWISMNDPQRAIEILSAQEQLEHPDSPVPWLFLLDLYRTVHDQVKYDRLRDRFIVFFNANIPEFSDDLTQIPDRHLEDFPHLIKIICDAWGGNNIIPYLESLLVDDREGKRAGFDLPVYRDILMLLGIAHELDKMKAVEASTPTLPAQASAQAPVSEPVKNVDHLADAEFDSIEFETIDFPIDAHKK